MRRHGMILRPALAAIVKSLAALALTATVILPTNAYPQNVLLPPTNSTPAKPVLPVPASPAPAAATTTTSTPAPPASLPDLSGNAALSSTGVSVGGHSAPATPTLPIYISPEQQAQMLSAEKQSMAAQQQGIAQLSQNAQALMQQARTPGLTPQQKAGIDQQMQDNAQQLQQFNAMQQQNQQRLKMLQSGPVTVTDLMKLYQH